MPFISIGNDIGENQTVSKALFSAFMCFSGFHHHPIEKSLHSRETVGVESKD